MRITVSVELDPSQWHEVIDFGEWLKNYLSSFKTLLRTQGERMTAEMQAVVNQVENLTSVTQGAVNTLDALGNLIRENANNPAQLLKIADDLQANSGAIAAAIARNTPGAPTGEGGGTPDTSSKRR
jgi:hypothetical protein